MDLKNLLLQSAKSGGISKENKQQPKLYEEGSQGLKEMEELSKIKYSIGKLIEKRQEEQSKNSVEVRFAEALNTLSTGA